MATPITDNAIGIAVIVTIMKNIQTYYFDQYYNVECWAKFISFKKLIFLRQSKCPDTKSYFAKFSVFYLCFSDKKQKLDKQILVYFLLNNLASKQISCFIMI